MCFFNQTPDPGGCHGNQWPKVLFQLYISSFLSALVALNLLTAVSEGFFIPMATVTKEIRPQYFSCN